MNDAQLAQLQEEQRKGGAAQHAYDAFIKDFCEQKRMTLFDAFSAIPISNEEGLMEIKRMLYAIDTLETEIMTIIETGRLASESLNDYEEVIH